MPACPWTEFTTPEGNPYYYNNITQETKWEMPPEYRAFKFSQTSTETPKSTTTTVTQTAVAAKKEEPAQTNYRPTDAIEEDPAVKAEAKEKFMEMMKERGVKMDFTWDMAMDKIIDDPRYKLLRLLADRKAAFYEFIEMLRNEEARKIQEDQGKAREDFMELLKEHTELGWNDSFRKFSQAVENDKRWFGLRSDIERECLFEEHLLELKRASEVSF